MSNLTGKEKMMLAGAALALVLIGIEVGKHLTLVMLKRRMAEGKDARPAAAAAPAPEAS